MSRAISNDGLPPGYSALFEASEWVEFPTVTELESLDWPYDRWTSELARFFFGGRESGVVVAFCADGGNLAALRGATESVAIESLRAAVAMCVMPGYRFGIIGRLAGQWERDG